MRWHGGTEGRERDRGDSGDRGDRKMVDGWHKRHLCMAGVCCFCS